MGTLMRSLRRAGMAAVLGVTAVGLSAGGVMAQGGALVGSDRPAAVLVYPLIDTGFRASDTYVEIANTNSDDPVNVHCFYVNALGTCVTGSVGEACLVDNDCGVLEGRCQASACTGTNFMFRLTREQPVGWLASQGLSFLPCDPAGAPPSVPECAGGQTNADLGGAAAAVPPTDVPFRGEMKCIEVDEDGRPTDGNDLIGRATLISTDDNGGPDAVVYSAIGIQAESGANDGDEVLCLGGAADSECATAEYAACPATLIMLHEFDQSSGDGSDSTRLTLVPCTEFEAVSSPVPSTVQFLVFNEFEQRMSTSTRISCYSDLTLSDIDTRAGYSGDDGTSVFGLGVQGTLTGQARIRGVGTSEAGVGHGILGVAVHSSGTGDTEPIVVGSGANLHMVGTRQQPDSVHMPQP